MFGFRRYNRPTLKWECGRACEGRACAAGPDGRGRCVTRFECKPLSGPNGFECARPPQAGGACKDGPLPDGTCCLSIPPCSPRRTLRARRSLLVLGTSVLSLGLCFYFLGMARPHQGFLSGGTVSNRHSSIKHQCSSCHATVEGNVVNWILSSKHPHVSSDKCLSCHTMSEHGLSPHGMDPATLAKVTKDRLGGKEAAPNQSKLECATCHKEHHGFRADINAMTNNQCQTCHAVRFASFASGHPEFAKFPFTRRNRIFFDHNEHFGKHFEKAGVKDIRCQTCHSPDSTGRLMVVNGFEKACAQCHSPQIHGVDQLEKGIVFIRVPGVDVKTIRKAGLAIGQWPEDADGGLTPFQKILIASDGRFADAYSKVAALDLSDLRGASKEELEAAVQVLWGVKSLLVDFLGEDNKPMRKKLEGFFKRPLSEDELSALGGALPPDTLRAAAAGWFKGLGAEVAAFSAGRKAPTRFFKQPKNLKDGDAEWVAAGGWYRSLGDYTVRYRPTGHADPFIRTWLDLSAPLSESSKPGKDLFASLTSRKANPGTCVKCHSVDAVAGSPPRVNWRGKNGENEAKGFVSFRHVSHFSLLGSTGCVTCHTFNKDSEYDKAYTGRDIAVFDSNFQPIKKATCAACHQSDKAGDTCLSCHNYHVGQPSSASRSFLKVTTVLDAEAQPEAGAAPTAAQAPTPAPTPSATPATSH